MKSISKILPLLFLFINFIPVTAQLHEQLMREGKSFEEIVRQNNLHFDEKGRTKGLGHKQFQRWQYWASRNLDSNGFVISTKEASKSYQKFLQQNPPNRNVTGAYEEMGPLAAVNTSTWSSHIGRVSALGLDPNDDAHILVGSPTGGIWKTTSLGELWTPIYDNAALIDVWSLEISHANSDHYLAGLDFGMIRSVNGGINWTAVTGLDDSDRYNTIIMDPNDEDIIYTIGQSNGGIYKSTNGGISFTQTYDHTSRMYDLEFKPGFSNTIYASGNGVVLKSTDSGVNWSSLTGPWNGSNAIMLAVTPDDVNYIYALQEISGGFNGLFRSSNDGGSWTTQSDNSCNCNNIMGYDQNSTGGQAPRDMDVAVSPIDKDEVHVAGTETHRSFDGGVSWTKSTSWYLPDPEPFIHADIDLLVYNGSRLYAGTDGGLFYSTDEANSFIDITQGLGIRQFYRIGASQTDVDRVSGGSQDNGTGLIKSGVWYDYMGADGMETMIDWSNADIVYGTIQNGPIYKSNDGGNSAGSITQAPGSGNWVTPLEQDPTDPNTIYTGKGEVYKSTVGGGSWTPISSFGSGNLNELKIAPSNNQYLYASIGATLYKTSNGGNSWTNVSPGGSVNYITIHPTDPNRVAVAISGSGTKVFETTNGGNTWNDLTANIPTDVSIECVLYENDGNLGMFLGGNPGLWFKDNSSGDDWTSITGNLPQVRVTELEIRNQTLYVGTYGRGLWKASLNVGPAISFVDEGISITEGTNCNELSIDIELGILIAGSNNPGASISVDPSSTATLGTDFDFTTTQVIFPTGSTASQFINLTIDRDAIDEITETIVLSISSTSGDGVLGIYSSYTIEIENDDVLAAGETVAIFSEDFNTNPVNWSVGDGGNTPDTWRLSALYGSSSLDGTNMAIVDSDEAGSGNVVQDTLFSEIYDITNANTPTLEFDQFFRVYTAGVIETADVEVFDGTNWVNIYALDQNDGSKGAWNVPDHQAIDISSYANANFQARFIYYGEYDWWWAIDNVAVKTPYQVPVATIANASGGFATFNFGPNQTVYVFDEFTDEIMMSIQNLSNHDYGCTQVSIVNAGTSTYTSNAAESTDISDKNFAVVPTFNNNNATYAITLYYTDAEIQGWVNDNSQGLTINDLAVLKADGSLLSATEIETSVSSPISYFSDWSFTGNFSTGFSVFGLGDIVSNCPPNYSGSNKLLGSQNSSFNYETDGEIESEQQVSGASTLLKYDSKIQISLLPGFSVDGNAIFETVIDGCGEN